MLETAIPCGYCGTVCQSPLTHRQNRVQCANCNVGITLYAFPALVQQEKTGIPAPKLSEEDGSCYYHVEARAERVCEDCGRFLCGLCEISYKGKCLCTNCIQALEDGEDKPFRGEIFRFDILALHAALITSLICLGENTFAFITTPMVMFLVIFGWSKPHGVIPRSRWRYVVATLIVLAQISVSIGLLIVKWTGM